MTELTLQKAQYFAQQARAYLVEKALEMVELTEIGGEYPDLMKDMRLLELVELLEAEQNPYPDEESLLEAIDSIRINIVSGLVPVEADEHCGDEVDVVNQIYTPLPGGGDTQSYLGQNLAGDLVWKKMPTSRTTSELSDGTARLRWSGKRWEWSTDGLQYFDLWYKADAESILDDSLISDKKGWSSKKITEELAKKVSVRTGYALSKNDFTDELKKLLGVLKINTTTPKKLLCMDGLYRSVDELGFSNNTNLPANLVYDSLSIRNLDDNAKQEGQQCIVKDATGEPLLPSGARILWAVYYWANIDGGSWKLMVLGAKLEETSAYLNENLTVNGVTVGGILDGEAFMKGASLEDLFRKMLIKQIPPVYNSPTLSLSVTGSPANIEAGTSIDLLEAATFDQKDGGAATGVSFRKNGLEEALDALAPYGHDPLAYVIGDENIIYQAVASYEEGPVKNDNLGVPYPNGHILAGSVNSNTVIFRGQRNAFYGVNNPDNTSASVRALTGKLLNAANGTVFNIAIPAGSTKVTFAYKDTLRDVTSVKYVEGSNAEVKANFVKTAVLVEGAAAFAAIGYKVYEFTPAAPFSGAATYNVTI